MLVDELRILLYQDELPAEIDLEFNMENLIDYANYWELHTRWDYFIQQGLIVPVDTLPGGEQYRTWRIQVTPDIRAALDTLNEQLDRYPVLDDDHYIQGLLNKLKKEVQSTVYPYRPYSDILFKKVLRRIHQGTVPLEEHLALGTVYTIVEKVHAPIVLPKSHPHVRRILQKGVQHDGSH